MSHLKKFLKVQFFSFFYPKSLFNGGKKKKVYHNGKKKTKTSNPEIKNSRWHRYPGSISGWHQLKYCWIGYEWGKKRTNPIRFYNISRLKYPRTVHYNKMLCNCMSCKCSDKKSKKLVIQIIFIPSCSFIRVAVDLAVWQEYTLNGTIHTHSHARLIWHLQK